MPGTSAFAGDGLEKMVPQFSYGLKRSSQAWYGGNAYSPSGDRWTQFATTFVDDFRIRIDCAESVGSE